MSAERRLTSSEETRALSEPRRTVRAAAESGAP